MRAAARLADEIRSHIPLEVRPTIQILVRFGLVVLAERGPKQRRGTLGCLGDGGSRAQFISREPFAVVDQVYHASDNLALRVAA